MSSFLSHRRKAFRGDGIKEGLVAWYDLEEASGTRSDAHTNGLDLTENGTIGSTTGQVGDAADKASAGTDSLYHADDSLLDITGDLTLAGWVKYDAKTRIFPIIGKSNGTGNQRSYLLYKQTDSNKMRFLVSDDGTSAGNTIIESSSTFGTGAWYFVVGVLSAGGTMELFVNNSSEGTATAPSAIYSSTSRLELWNINGGTATTESGNLDSVAIWNRALSTDEITTLYNSGSGVAYSDL